MNTKPAIVLIGLLLLAHAAVADTFSFTFTYDAADRLVAVNAGGNTNITCTYDNNGNILALSAFLSGTPDVSLTQSADSEMLPVGGLLQYTLVAVNNSGIGADNAVVQDQLPPNTSLVSATTSQGTVTQAGNVLTWQIGTLGPGAAATLWIRVRASAAGPLANNATLSTSENDPSPVNNASTLSVAVVEPPRLSALVSGAELTLNWPLYAANYSLEFTDSLVPPVAWLPSDSVPRVQNDHFFVAEPFAATSRFYRLHQLDAAR